MSAAFAALVPVFLVILTGVVLKRVAPLSAEGWRGFGHVTYYVFFPALIIDTLKGADLTLASLVGVGEALALAVGAAGGLLLLARRRVIARVGGPAFTSVFQGGLRWNAFVALAVAEALFGRTGLSLTAIAFVALMPGLNIASVWVLARDGARAVEAEPAHVLRDIASNPFIWALAIGLLLAPVDAAIPDVIDTTIDVLGRAALGAGLVMVGAGLQMRALARPEIGLLLACAIKLLLVPVFAWLAGLALDLQPTEMAIVLIAASVPTASGAYVLAEKMGGDAPLMARIVTIQTLVAFLTMPLFLALALR